MNSLQFSFVARLAHDHSVPSSNRDVHLHDQYMHDHRLCNDRVVARVHHSNVFTNRFHGFLLGTSTWLNRTDQASTDGNLSSVRPPPPSISQVNVFVCRPNPSMKWTVRANVEKR